MTIPYTCFLDTRWTAQGDEHGRFLCRLTNISDTPIENFRLGLTTVTLNLDADRFENAERVRFEGSCLEVAPPAQTTLAAGESWSFAFGGLFRNPRHLVDGMSAAYLILEDGTITGVRSGDLLLEDAVSLPPGRDVPPGALTLPIGIMPWPNACHATDFAAPPVVIYPAETAPIDLLRDMAEATDLARRLFPVHPMPFALARATGGLPLSGSVDSTLPPGGYRLDFAADGIALAASDSTGRWHGLVTLAQMLHAAHADPEAFSFPRGGHIDDMPRYQWRGCHLDVSRQLYPVDAVRRFIDILAWNKLNVLHWHLTDDEGWRVEIKALPQLAAIGSRRGPAERLAPQLGTGAESVAFAYTQAEIADLVAHARGVRVDILPEVDVPGHCFAMLEALPYLRDPAEPAGSYVSGQGFANNALNPGVDAVYETLELVFGELAALFPFDYFHIGGDEVAGNAWLQSPLARALMAREGLTDTPEVQAYFLRRVKAMLTRLGKQLAGWNEVAHGGGIDRDGTLLVAWMSTALGPELAAQGYDVVMAPGEAYYLDMARSDAWLEVGHHWAGTVTPRKTYDFEAAEHFPEGLLHRLKGIQAGIWGENLNSVARFNHMVFPRLGAVAEAAWTETSQKNWLRFCAQSRLMPKL